MWEKGRTADGYFFGNEMRVEGRRTICQSRGGYANRKAGKLSLEEQTKGGGRKLKSTDRGYEPGWSGGDRCIRELRAAEIAGERHGGSRQGRDSIAHV
jgi:hypothetical protein